jgi:hypothetical protein
VPEAFRERLIQAFAERVRELSHVFSDALKQGDIGQDIDRQSLPPSSAQY